MTPGEIVASYRWAEKKKKQIGILAELNDTTQERIRAILRAAGVLEETTSATPEQTPTRKRGRTGRIDEAQGRALFEEGLSDADAAERLGVTPDSYRVWRSRHGLLRRGRKADTPAAAPETAAAAVDLKEFAATLKELAQRYPDLRLTAAGRPVTGARLTVRLDLSGAMAAALDLEVGI